MASSLARVFARGLSPVASFQRDIDRIIGFHVSARRHALAALNMPAMSPTMTEGGIASWKKNEGEPFSAGDVLLEIVFTVPASITFYLLT
jgi:pyruvate dehydrogenase E2 component (dihydrolipoamide acetyltransferase)